MKSLYVAVLVFGLLGSGLYACDEGYEAAEMGRQLYFATLKDDVEKVRELLFLRADPNYNQGLAGFPLEIAFKKKNNVVSADIVDLLLQKGANPYLCMQLMEDEQHQLKLRQTDLVSVNGEKKRKRGSNNSDLPNEKSYHFQQDSL